jgi:hypothetical protein
MSAFAIGMRQTGLPHYFVLTVVGEMCTRVLLTWPAYPNISEYQILRNEIIIALLPGTATSYSDSTVAPFTECSYRVVAHSLCGSTISVPRIGRRFGPPPPVTGFDVNCVFSSVQITWAEAANADSVIIYRDSTRIGTVPVSQTLFIDQPIMRNVWYTYSVQPKNLCGYGLRSQGIAVYASGVNQDPSLLPTTTALHSSYPNPFNARTTIAFDLAQTAHLRLAVFDLMGRRVAELTNETMSPGRYTIPFDASSLPSGVYLCRMTAGNYSAKQKLLLMK